MSKHCTRCGGCGFLNIELVPIGVIILANEGVSEFHEVISGWLADADVTAVSVCDCCGNGENWHGTPGEHYNDEDPRGPRRTLCLQRRALRMQLKHPSTATEPDNDEPDCPHCKGRGYHNKTSRAGFAGYRTVEVACRCTKLRRTKIK